jgi:hypothetical protein
MDDDVKMMTYVDAASVLGVKVDSVKRRARNRRWKREKGNDGLVRIGVPVEIFALSRTENPPDRPPDDTGDILRLEKQVSALDTEVKMLRERQDDLMQDRDHWRAMAQRPWWHFTR